MAPCVRLMYSKRMCGGLQYPQLRAAHVATNWQRPSCASCGRHSMAMPKLRCNSSHQYLYAWQLRTACDTHGPCVTWARMPYTQMATSHPQLQPARLAKLCQAYLALLHSHLLRQMRDLPAPAKQLAQGALPGAWFLLAHAAPSTPHTTKYALTNAKTCTCLPCKHRSAQYAKAMQS